MNVFTYLRVSGQGQIDKDGFTRQREAIAKFNEQHNLFALGEFVEAGVTGTIDGSDRPAFADLMTKAAGLPDFKIEAIVVERMDRLARDLMVSEILLRDCRKAGIKVFCADQGHLIDMAAEEGDASRVLIRQIFGALAQWEKSCLVAKLKVARKRAKAIRTGGNPEGKKPFGFHPNEVTLLREMRGLKDKDFSYDEIAIELNVQGYKTRHGKKWNKSNVHTAMSGRQRKRPLCAVPTSNS